MLLFLLPKMSDLHSLERQESVPAHFLQEANQESMGLELGNVSENPLKTPRFLGMAVK